MTAIATKAVTLWTLRGGGCEQLMSAEDLTGLPPELLAQLSLGMQPDPLIEIINEQGGTASLNDIIVALYRLDGGIRKRNAVANRLYRLCKRGRCSRVSRGVYTTDSMRSK